MAPNNVTPQHAPILPPQTPANNNSRPPSSQGQKSSQRGNATVTPTTESRMNPPAVPRSMMSTPVREREGSVVSSAGSSTRKPRQNLDEADHLSMLKHCYENRENFKEGTKSQFWATVNLGFQADTGKVLAQLSATVGRLVEARRRQLNDWEHGVIPTKPGGEMNDAVDRWMEFLKTEDGEAEAERMRQVDARRRLEEQRKETRRQAVAAETLVAANTSGVRAVSGPPPDGNVVQPVQRQLQPQLQPQPQLQHEGDVEMANGEHDMNEHRPNKRKRLNERQMSRELQTQLQQEQLQYQIANPPEPPRRVVVEGALTKEDWRDIMGNDARLRALENKVDKIELLVSQNNKLLLQLGQNQNKERTRTEEEERVPVHLDAEFERDYLSGRYAKTPLPIT